MLEYKVANLYKVNFKAKSIRRKSRGKDCKSFVITGKGDVLGLFLPQELNMPTTYQKCLTDLRLIALQSIQNNLLNTMTMQLELLEITNCVLLLTLESLQQALTIQE